MHYVVDVREACGQRRTGKGQWVYGFVQELLTRDHQVTLLSNAPVPEEWRNAAAGVHIFSKGWRWHWQANRFLRRQKASALYVSTTSYIVPCLLGSSVPFVPVVHDLIAFQGGRHDAKAKLIERLTLQYCLRRSRHVLTVSGATKRDVLQRYPWLSPEQIAVIYAGPLRPDPASNTPDGSTIFCPATLCPRKNQLRLIQAYAALPQGLRDRCSLLLVGARGWHDDEIVAAVRQTDGVTWHNYVPDERYEELLQTCHALALPSLYEGFGMQILDALQRGIPVLTSNRGSLEEVAGSAAVLVDPESVDSITNGLQRLLTDEKLRSELRRTGPKQAASFSWRRTVDIFLQATDNLL